MHPTSSCIQVNFVCAKRSLFQESARIARQPPTPKNRWRLRCQLESARIDYSFQNEGSYNFIPTAPKVETMAGDTWLQQPARQRERERERERT